MGRPSGTGVAKKSFRKYSGLFFEGSPLLCKDSKLKMYGEYKDGQKFGKQTKHIKEAPYFINFLCDPDSESTMI